MRENLISTDPARFTLQVGDIGSEVFALVEFTLRYKGSLTSGGDNPVEKHRIRKTFHRQLASLWSENHTLAKWGDAIAASKDASTGEVSFMPRAKAISLKFRSDCGRFRFLPLVTKALALVCSIDIQFLRRSDPGEIVTHGGDLDNRLKTLFDALRVPTSRELKRVDPEAGEDPFYCLLEDAALIVGFCVETDRLLEPIADRESRTDVDLVLRVKVRPIARTEENSMF